MVLELFKKRLDSDDPVQKCYDRIQSEGKNGCLVLPNKKILFLEAKGFLRKTYSPILEIPYEKIDKITAKDRYNLEVEVGGKTHSFKSQEFSVSTVKRSLKELIESAMAKAEA